MALRLYKDAVMAGYIEWTIPGIPLDQEGMSQPACSPALPQARTGPHPAPSRPPSQAFRSSQTSHVPYSQHMQTSSSTPRHTRTAHPRGRALEPHGPSNSPSAHSWHPTSSSGGRPNPSFIPGVARLQSDLLMHPSNTIIDIPDHEEEDLSLSQRLSQACSSAKPLFQSASQPLHVRQAAVSRPQAKQQQPVNAEDVLSVMEFTHCSYAKAQKVLHQLQAADTCNVINCCVHGKAAQHRLDAFKGLGRRTSTPALACLNV